MASVSPVYARVVIREFQRQGLPVTELLSGTSLTLEQLYSGKNVSLQNYSAFFQNAMRIGDSPGLGFMIGRCSHVVALGPLGAASLSAPTLREGLRSIEVFSRVEVGHISVQLESDLGGLWLGVRLEGLDAKMEQLHTEVALVLLKRYIELMDGRPLTGAEFLLNYPAPSHAELYSTNFHNSVTFEAGRHAIHLTGLEFDAPLPFYNADVWHQNRLFLENAMKTLHKTEGNTYTQHVQAHMRSSEPPLPDLSTVAETMHVSKRTLNRRLSAEGTSFQTIRSLELENWAKRYLLNTELSVDAIAAVLGYQDTANFRRAFKAWEKCSPVEYRMKGRAQD